MRIILGILVVLAIGGGWAAHRQRATTALSATAAPKLAAAAAPSASVSQHNWPKNALNRASEVKREVLAQRKSNAEK